MAQVVCSNETIFFRFPHHVVEQRWTWSAVLLPATYAYNTQALQPKNLPSFSLFRTWKPMESAMIRPSNTSDTCNASSVLSEILTLTQNGTVLRRLKTRTSINQTKTIKWNMTKGRTLHARLRNENCVSIDLQTLSTSSTAHHILKGYADLLLRRVGMQCIIIVGSEYVRVS